VNDGRAGQTLLAGNRRGVKRSADVVQQLTLERLRDKLDAMVPLVRKVMKQTRARILRGNTRGDGKLHVPGREAAWAQVTSRWSCPHSVADFALCCPFFAVRVSRRLWAGRS
jgi:hypothetical protein